MNSSFTEMKTLSTSDKAISAVTFVPKLSPENDGSHLQHRHYFLRLSFPPPFEKASVNDCARFHFLSLSAKSPPQLNFARSCLIFGNIQEPEREIFWILLKRWHRNQFKTLDNQLKKSAYQDLEHRKAEKVILEFSFGCVLQTSLARSMSGTPPKAPTAVETALKLAFSFSRRTSKSRGRPSHASIEEKTEDNIGSDRRWDSYVCYWKRSIDTCEENLKRIRHNFN